LRASATDLAGRRSNWPGAQIDRVVYCTARIDGASNPSGQADQDVYLKALMAAGSVDHIEYGTYVARVKMAPLATKDLHGRPQLVSPAWPVMIQDGGGAPVTGAVEEQADRDTWPWLPGSIVEQCGPDEWYVCVEVRELAVLRDGRRAPRGAASRNL
jgi:hypothetical protein